MFKQQTKTKKQPSDYYYQGYYNSKSLRSIFYRNKFHYILKRLIQNNTQTLLDLGCGNGILIKLAKDKGIDAFGVDNSEDFLLHARRLVGKENIKREDILDLDLKRKFDTVTCLDALEHFKKKDLYVVFSRIKSHLKKDGVVIITLPSILYIRLIEPIWKLLRFCFYGKTRFIDEDIHNLVGLLEIKRIAAKEGLVLQEKRLILAGLLNFMIFQPKAG